MWMDSNYWSYISDILSIAYEKFQNNHFYHGMHASVLESDAYYSLFLYKKVPRFRAITLSTT